MWNLSRMPEFLKNSNYPIVVKADNLASGKGVYICNNKNESFSAINEIFDYGRPKEILLYVLIDRQLSELPIKPNFSACEINISKKYNSENLLKVSRNISKTIVLFVSCNLMMIG